MTVSLSLFWRLSVPRRTSELRTTRVRTPLHRRGQERRICVERTRSLRNSLGGPRRQPPSPRNGRPPPSVRSSLERLTAKHPSGQNRVEYRCLQQLKNAYFLALLSLDGVSPSTSLRKFSDETDLGLPAQRAEVRLRCGSGDP